MFLQFSKGKPLPPTHTNTSFISSNPSREKSLLEGHTVGVAQLYLYLVVPIESTTQKSQYKLIFLALISINYLHLRQIIVRLNFEQ